MNEHLFDEVKINAWQVSANKIYKYADTLKITPSEALGIIVEEWIGFTHGEDVEGYSCLNKAQLTARLKYLTVLSENVAKEAEDLKLWVALNLKQDEYTEINP